MPKIVPKKTDNINEIIILWNVCKKLIQNDWFWTIFRTVIKTFFGEGKINSALIIKDKICHIITINKKEKIGIIWQIFLFIIIFQNKNLNQVIFHL